MSQPIRDLFGIFNRPLHAGYLPRAGASPATAPPPIAGPIEPVQPAQRIINNIVTININVHFEYVIRAIALIDMGLLLHVLHRIFRK
ncbi:hypothetical protein EW026_g6568 [Hermanssonia centrifuga]|uniref:Uncharacterized protein n=1 Tax=Hermanssonia centrifuga TaxID=98765 RepID=A0A4V3X9P8_9APHY|nr:hypothetical protein EW026_g6568 [Hermanssonia centrifuga]